MTTIEKMAKATYVKWVEDVQDLEPPWDDLPESHRDRLIDATRAALQAIREVPESISSVAKYDEYDWAGRNFTAMIDAVLSEQEILEEKPE